jgi:hypothetical protein
MLEWPLKECLEVGAEFFLSKARDFGLLPSILGSFSPEAAKGGNQGDDLRMPPGSGEEKPP